jgi:hypothetical protein
MSRTAGFMQVIELSLLLMFGVCFSSMMVFTPREGLCLHSRADWEFRCGWITKACQTTGRMDFLESSYVVVFVLVSVLFDRCRWCTSILVLNWRHVLLKSSQSLYNVMGTFLCQANGRFSRLVFVIAWTRLVFDDSRFSELACLRRCLDSTRSRRQFYLLLRRDLAFLPSLHVK